MYSCCKVFTMSACVSILALSLEIKGKASEMIPCPDKPRLQLRADSRKPRPAAPRRKTWRLLHSVVREEVQKLLLNLMNTVLGQVSRLLCPSLLSDKSLQPLLRRADCGVNLQSLSLKLDMYSNEELYSETMSAYTRLS